MLSFLLHKSVHGLLSKHLNTATSEATVLEFVRFVLLKGN